MTAQSLRWMTELRAIARSTGLTKPLGRVLAVVDQITGRQAYEAKFDVALMQAMRPGDVVWDVGANVGLYTTRFAQAVGPTGRVLAFEPTPVCFAQLGQAVSGRSNVQLLQLALGAQAGTFAMSLADDPLGATHSLAVAAGASSVDVEVARGDDLIASGRAPQPDVLKIDVEGFELDVLEGLTQCLAHSRCRAVFCEVHFALLDQRGQRQAPAQIVEALTRNGFRTRWVDASHLAALRAH